MQHKIFFYNSLSNKMQEFIPIDKLKITMYVCGPTVYNHIHIGNARPLIVFDVLYRLLQYVYGKNCIIYARNITDIDDKIINQAKLENVPIDEITNKNIGYFIEMVELLNLLPPTFQPKATDYIIEIQNLISTLLNNQIAYIKDNHIYFSVDKYIHYGKISNNTVQQMYSGARVEIEQQKHNPLDFVLWKPSNNNEPGWNFNKANIYGRPGWHIECSAMIKALLADTIDIHAGGTDLMFPHHENENAQSCCANNTLNLANYWLHNGFITLNGQKMSKSTGNVVLLKDLFKEYTTDEIKLTILSTHYKQNLDITDSLLKQSKKNILKFNNAFNKLLQVNNYQQYLKPNDQFITYLSNDLNTPAAISVLHTLISKNTTEQLGEFVFCAQLIGLLQNNTLDKKPINSNINTNLIVNKIKERDYAKLNKNYKLADSIRLELLKIGITLKDTKNGTTWEQD